MSQTAVVQGTPPATPNNSPDPAAEIGEIKKALATLADGNAAMAKSIADLNLPNRQGVNVGDLAGGNGPPNAMRSGSRGDRPYSFLKAIAAFRPKPLIDPAEASYEKHVSDELRKFYCHAEVGQSGGVNTILAPYGIDFMPSETQAQESLQAELKQKFARDSRTFVDPDELGYIKKALGTNVDTAGGPLLGFPSLGELVDMQRNLEVFSNAGATQVPLGPNGQMYYPKLISGATAYFVDENPASALSTSQPTTGSLLLAAKTLAVRVPISNQLLKFNLISAEAMVRLDMARVAALKADSSMFDGVGGRSIKGLLTYDTQATWASGTDKLIAVVATTTGSDGNTLNSKDLYILNGALPDQISGNLTWIFRKNFWWSYIATARAGGSTTGDGPYLLSLIRSIEQGVTSGMFLGNKLILSSQSPATRIKGSGTNLVCVILGFFPDWLIGRAGVVELDTNPYGDTAWGNIQTELRMVEYIDAGPRHSASFAVIDTLLPTAFTA